MYLKELLVRNYKQKILNPPSVPKTIARRAAPEYT